MRKATARSGMRNLFIASALILTTAIIGCNGCNESKTAPTSADTTAPIVPPVDTTVKKDSLGKALIDTEKTGQTVPPGTGH